MLKQKILLLLLVISLIGTFFGVVNASFDNTAIKNDNILASGNLNLKAGDNDGTSATILATGMSPGDNIGPASIKLTNSGYINGSNLNIRFSYTNKNDTQTLDTDLDASKTADAVAAELVINTLAYDQLNLLDKIDDSNSNGRIDIQDVAEADLTRLTGIEALKSTFFVIQLTASNKVEDVQTNDIEIRINFTLNR